MPPPAGLRLRRLRRALPHVEQPPWREGKAAAAPQASPRPAPSPPRTRASCLACSSMAAHGWGGAEAMDGAAAEAGLGLPREDEAAESSSSRQSPLPHSQRALLSSPHVGPVLVARWSSTGEYVLTGGQDRTVQLWNPSKEKHIKEYAGVHGREVKDVQISPSSDRFVSCGGDRTVFLWDVSTGECIRRLRGHDAAVNSVSYSADGGLLASASYDQSVKLWDVRSNARQPVQEMRDAKDSVTAVRIHHTDVWTSSMDGCVRRYDVRKASKVTDHIATPLSSLLLSNDGHCVLLSCLDSALRLLDVASGELLNEYTAPGEFQAREFRMEGAFDAQDAHVASGSEDGSVIVWELVEARPVRRYLGHTGAVSSIAWHPKEKAFISAGVDGTIRYWK